MMKIYKNGKKIKNLLFDERNSTGHSFLVLEILGSEKFDQLLLLAGDSLFHVEPV